MPITVNKMLVTFSGSRDVAGDIQKVQVSGGEAIAMDGNGNIVDRVKLGED